MNSIVSKLRVIGSNVSNLQRNRTNKAFGNNFLPNSLVKQVKSFSTEAKSTNIPLVNWYLTQLHKYPMVTKMCTSGFMAGAGDVGCQLLIEKNETINVHRFALFAGLGAVMVAPVLHYWYGFLGKKFAGTSAKATVQRVLADQLIFAPLFVPVFLSTVYIFEGNASSIPDMLKKEYISTVTANWFVWTPAQLVNFKFIPGNLQVLFANFVSLVWNSYLSYVSHRDEDIVHAHDTSTQLIEE